MADTPILARLKRQLYSKGHDKEAAQKIAVSALQRSGNLKKGSTEPTAQGKQRGAMSNGARAKDRAARYSGKNDPKDYNYDPDTNRAKLKKGK